MKSLEQLKNLERNAGAKSASDLLALVRAEIERRHPRRREKVGPLWWDKHDPAHSTFHAYADAKATRRVGSILKMANHGSRKEVYTLQMGEQVHPVTFHHVADAREAGSAMWQSKC